MPRHSSIRENPLWRGQPEGPGARLERAAVSMNKDKGKVIGYTASQPGEAKSKGSPDTRPPTSTLRMGAEGLGPLPISSGESLEPCCSHISLFPR